MGGAGAVAVAAEHLAATPWASVTFSGERHRVAISGAAGERLDRWLAALPDAELVVAGHLVADVAVGADLPSPAGARRVTIEVLLLDT